MERGILVAREYGGDRAGTYNSAVGEIQNIEEKEIVLMSRAVSSVPGKTNRICG